MKNYNEILLKLLQENPRVAICPMVGNDVVCDHGWNKGDIYKIELKKYAILPEDDERIYFDDDEDEICENYYDWYEEELTGLSEGECYCKASEYFNQITWEKAIFIYIL